MTTIGFGKDCRIQNWSLHTPHCCRITLASHHAFRHSAASTTRGGSLGKCPKTIRHSSTMKSQRNKMLELQRRQRLLKGRTNCQRLSVHAPLPSSVTAERHYLRLPSGGLSRSVASAPSPSQCHSSTTPSFNFALGSTNRRCLASALHLSIWASRTQNS